MGLLADPPRVLLPEGHVREAVAIRALGSEVHPLGAGVQRQHLRPPQAGLDRVDPLAAAQVQDPQLLERVAREVAVTCIARLA